jgi:hypothetical protein
MTSWAEAAGRLATDRDEKQALADRTSNDASDQGEQLDAELDELAVGLRSGPEVARVSRGRSMGSLQKTVAKTQRLGMTDPTSYCCDPGSKKGAS